MTKRRKRCRVCGKSISTAFGHYQRHMATHRKCPECGASLVSGRLPKFAVCPNYDDHFYFEYVYE